jgi:ankyrin repeat protein
VFIFAAVACEKGHLSLVRFLLRHSAASAYVYDAETNISPLMWAAGSGHASTVAVSVRVSMLVACRRQQ